MKRWVSLKQLVAETGFAPRTLQYIRTQEPTVLSTRLRGKALEYEQPACSIALRKREVDHAVAAAMPADLDTARARKANAEAEITEIELAKARINAMSLEDYDRAIGAFADRFVSLVRALPVRLAHLGEAVESEAESEVERMITELHQMDDDILPDEPEAEAA